MDLLKNRKRVPNYSYKLTLDKVKLHFRGTLFTRNVSTLKVWPKALERIGHLGAVFSRLLLRIAYTLKAGDYGTLHAG